MEYQGPSGLLHKEGRWAICVGRNRFRWRSSETKIMQKKTMKHTAHESVTKRIERVMHPLRKRGPDDLIIGQMGREEWLMLESQIPPAFMKKKRGVAYAFH